MTPDTSYFICTLPRSGSWLLAESLEKTGVAGRPREYFEPQLFSAMTNDALPSAINRIIRKGMTSNRVFGAKLHWYQFEHAPRIISHRQPGELPVALLMARRFPKLKYIWLTRRDKVRQAVSYYRATRTGVWWDIAGISPPVARLPDFDFQRILQLERLLLRHEACWQRYFDEHDIDPLVLVYEEFCDNHVEAVELVLQHLGIEYAKLGKIRSRLRRQADEVTEEWIERYLGMKGTFGSISSGAPTGVH
ncbi:LPS sulfotransferase NodH [Mesorhizobium loti]|uniref:LPS sulfotransferase NodH n=1 Tax=Rhizobium loti TaxID=381 RepID=A0A8E2W5Z2_RHILI|nr:Stf0 family sulfotransferase [Mesorhizobium loti]PWJ86906.1 LPS sulfotransferase NodH [Mesorhizobium loti]